MGLMPIMDNNKSLIMDSFKKLEIWFLTGSQHLYGQETLNKVADNAQHIVHYLKNYLPIQLIFKVKLYNNF